MQKKNELKDKSSKKPAIDVTSAILSQPKMVKKGQAKGAGMTVIVLCSKKKAKLVDKT